MHACLPCTALLLASRILLVYSYAGILGRVYFEKEEAVGWYHIPVALEQLFRAHEKVARTSSKHLPEHSVPTLYVGTFSAAFEYYL